MPDRGKVMSQTYYERQSRLFKLYQESFDRKEINVIEAVRALRIIGFGKAMAASRVNEWTANTGSIVPETEKVKKKRQRQQASLEKYILRIRLGKKYYDKYKSPSRQTTP